jgi:hypothetical protein
MLKQLLLLLLLATACVVIHGLGMALGLRWLKNQRGKHGRHFSLWESFRILISVVYGLLILHLIQIVVWAACYRWFGCFEEFIRAFYYSATSCSTVGYGDVIPPGNRRVLGAMEAVTGILMFGWSTGVLFAVVNQLQARFKDRQQPPAPRTTCERNS